MFNLVEVTGNNNLQVRELLQVNKVARKFHRSTSDSRDHGRVNAIGEIVYLADEPGLIQDLAALFPYIEPQYSDENPPMLLSDHPDGTHEDVSMIRIMASDQRTFRYDVTVHVVKNGRTEFSERKARVLVSALDDTSKLPHKVRQVANLLFTDEMKTTLVAEKQVVEEKAEAERLVAEEKSRSDQAAAQKRFSDAVSAEVTKQLSSQ